MNQAIPCGCCEGVTPETPAAIYNRPGLSAVAYRIGAYHQFRESLMAALTKVKSPALQQLTTRSSDDFTIALLDSWSVVADILTFYQERIVNESYLNTATELKSVLELARLIGYELRPGVAAGTYLAFTVEGATLIKGQIDMSGNLRSPDTPKPSIIPKGAKVQSIPAADEMPQTFETIEEIEARSEWNAMKPRQTQPVHLNADTIKLSIKGVANNLKVGDNIIFSADNAYHFKKVIKLTIDDATQSTILHFPQKNLTALPFVEMVSVQSQLYNAMTASGSQSQRMNALLQNTWHQSNYAFAMAQYGVSPQQVNHFFAAKRAIVTDNQVFVMRRSANHFGYNAPSQRIIYDQNTGDGITPPYAVNWVINNDDNRIYLDSAYESAVPGGLITVVKENGVSNTYTILDVVIRPHTEFGISSKSTVIRIEGDDNWWDGTKDMNDLQTTGFYIENEALTLVEIPIEDTVKGNTIMLETAYPELIQGRVIILFGERSDLPGVIGSEMRRLKEVYIQNGFTTIELDKPLDYEYIRKTVTLNANTAAATHGETVKEVLGSGDAAKNFQKFTLKQPPLTYVSAATPSGTQTTLEIRVNDILWKEVPTLYGAGPNDHVYITRRDEQAKTAVIFGDGKTGARLSTGQENVRATYRKGIGTEALLDAHQLSMLLSRPLGVKAVTNPFAPTGAQDPEIIEEAKENAALTIYTLGRIVSLQDYEDFARAFAGISKSFATWTWNGRQQEIFITVAGYDGADVLPDSDLYKNLIAAIRQMSIPDVAVNLSSFSRQYFRLEGSIYVNPDYIPDQVLEAVKTVLNHTFSFDMRHFGQNVSLSEVATVIQNVAGVIAVDLDKLYRADDPGMGLNHLLQSRIPRPGTDQLEPAELLMIDPIAINLNIRS